MPEHPDGSEHCRASPSVIFANCRSLPFALDHEYRLRALSPTPRFAQDSNRRPRQCVLAPRPSPTIEQMTASDDRWRDFDLAVARWRIGWLAIEQLPAAAGDALTAGCDTPALRTLAGMRGATWSEVEPLVLEVFRQRGTRLPSEDEAIAALADSVLRGVEADTIGQEEATLRLGALAGLALDRPPSVDLDAFLGYDHIWRDIQAGVVEEASPDSMLAKMRHQAAAILARGGVRSS